MADADSRRSVFLQGWGVLIGVPALFVFAYFLPRIPVVKGLALCSVRRFLGVDCPGCGLKSAFIALAHGNLRESIDIHPMGVIIALWLVYMLLRAVYACIMGGWPKAILTQGQRDVVLYVFLFGLMLQWIMKLVY